MIIKGRKNSRYYYNEPELFIYGPKERLKLKVNNADYQEIVKLPCTTTVPFLYRLTEGVFLRVLVLRYVLIFRPPPIPSLLRGIVCSHSSVPCPGMVCVED